MTDNSTSLQSDFTTGGCYMGSKKKSNIIRTGGSWSGGNGELAAIRKGSANNINGPTNQVNKGYNNGFAEYANKYNVSDNTHRNNKGTS